MTDRGLLLSTLALALGCNGVDSTRLLGPAVAPESAVSEPPAALAPSLPAAPAAGCRAGVTWPVFGARDVAINVAPELHFDAPVDPARLDGAIQFSRLDDGRAVPFELELIDAQSVRLVPEHPLAFWQSYALSVSGTDLACDGVTGVFSTLAPVFVPPALRAAAALDIARNGDVVYSTAPTFHGLQVHRIQGTELQLLGDVHWSGGSERVIVFGDRAYVAAGAQGVLILDVAEAELPRVIGGAGVRGGASDLAAFERAGREFVAVAAGAEGVAVVDVTDPERATLVSRFDNSGVRANQTSDLDLDGNILGVADGANGLFSLDLTDPAAPMLLGRSPDPSALRVKVAGDRLYALFAGWPRLRSYPATHPADMLGEWNSCGLPCGLYSTDLDRLGNELYVAASQGGMRRVSASAEGGLSESSQPPLRTRSAVQSVLAGEDGVLLGEVGGLALFAPDGTGPFGFDPDGHGDAYAVAVRGHYAYVAASFAGVQTFDISDPLAPRWVGRVDSPGMTSAQDRAATHVTLVGDVLVLSDGRAGLSLYRLTDPEQPRLYASFGDDVDWMNEAVVIGERVYVCNDNSGIDRIDLADADHPVRVPALRFAAAEVRACHTLAVHASEPLLYMADLRGISIYAVGPGGELTPLADYAPPFADTVGSMVVSGERLIAVTSVRDYLSGSSDGWSTRLQMFDLEDPRSPSASWHSEPLAALSTLAVAGQTLFTGGATNVSVYDLSGPEPELEGSVSTQSAIRQLFPTTDAVYVAQSTGGLGVLRTGPLSPASAGSSGALPASVR